MRFSWALLSLGACGFPQVALDGSQDATVDAEIDASNDVVAEGGKDAGPDVPAVTSGCKSNGDCATTCTGKLGISPCGCQAYLADSAPPTCDTSCAVTGCAAKSAVCADGGMCIIQ